MAYVIKMSRPADVELRRIIRKQLTLAADELSGASAFPNDRAIHEARRHVKKARAALRLSRAVLGRRFRGVNKRLRRASRLLAALADAESTRHVFADVSRSHVSELPRPVARSIAQHLRARRDDAIRQMEQHETRERVAVRLRREGRRVSRARAQDGAFELIASQLERTIQRSRNAMAEARTAPSAAAFHAWRRRVKDHWLQFRLLDLRCGGQLTESAAVLSRLDGILGTCHDLALLADAVRGASLPRPQAAEALRLLERLRRSRRAEALALGRDVYRSSARAAVAHVAVAWRATARREKRAVPCLRVA